jgi:SAM-dependent methyltransferase
MKKILVLSSLLFLLLVFSDAGSAAPSDPPKVEEHSTPAGTGHGHAGRDGHAGNDGDGEEHHRVDGDCGHGMPHDFSDAEAWSKRFDRPERDAWQKPQAVVDLMEIEPGMTVADLGAGTGYFLSYLSAAVGGAGKVLGLDPEAELVQFMVERAEREGWGNVEPRKIPYDDLGVEPGSLHRVLVVNTWHHIENREAYSERLLRALAPSGRVYIVDLTHESPSGPPPEHRLKPRQILGDLTQGGFEGKLLEEDLPRQFVVVAWRRGE